MQLKVGDLVKVVWEDAFHPTHCNWFDKDAVNEFLEDTEYMCENVGWVLHDDKRMLTLHSMRGNNVGSVSHIQRIPKGCILEIKKLSPNKAK